MNQLYEVEITGEEPGLLMNRFSQAMQKELKEPVKPASRSKLSPEEEAANSAYITVDGTLVQPGEHIYQSMIKAATEFKMVGRGKKSYKDVVKGCLFVKPEFIPHQSNEYEIDARRVVIQRAAVVKHRAFLPSWKLTFTIEVKNADIPDSVVEEILKTAGSMYGIGDYRPRFGRFSVTSFRRL